MARNELQSDRLQKAIDWLLQQQTDDGAVLNKPNGFKYGEITGYFVKFCLQYGLIEEAVRSANYLVSQNQAGFISWNGRDDVAYTFDTMIIADALMDMFDYSFQEHFFNAAHQMAGRIKQAWERIGKIPTMSNANGIFWNEPNVYYRLPGALYLKLIPIFQRFDMDTSYLEQFMSLQRDDGGFHCHPQTRYVFTHFHCYALDGIEEKYPRQYRRGAKWALKNLMPHDRLPAWSSDRSWSMPGANMQAAWHLHNIGYETEAQKLRDTGLEDQLLSGAIPIRTWGAAEAWPTVFYFLYGW